MYTKELFHKSIAVLVAAYMNDTLEHGNCSACAVGNLIAAGINAKPKMTRHMNNGELYAWSNGLRPEWTDVFVTPRPRSQQKQNGNAYYANTEARAQIDLTGYSWQDLARIESAFEKGNPENIIYIYPCKEKEEAMFLGLMAVVDVLCEIHGMNETEKQESKALFVKA